MRWLAPVCLMWCFAPLVWAEQGPFALRNIHPIALLYGLPRPLGTDFPEAIELSFNVEHASNFSSEKEGDTFFFFDGETSVVTYGMRRAFADRWEWGVELPWVIHTGGELDSFIDEFHELFGLNDGGRSAAPRGRLDYLVRYEGKEFADFQDGKRHIGDVRAMLGFSLWQSPARSMVVRGMIKAPTGTVETLSGSEATDVAISLDYTDTELLSWLGLKLSLMGGLVWLGDGELAPRAQNRVAGVGHLGLSYRLSDRVELLGQVDAQSRLLDSGLDPAGGAAIQGTLGGRIRMSPNAWLDLAVVEDLRSQSSSDVVFHIRLGVRL